MIWQFHVQDHSDEGGPEGAAENDRGDSGRAHRGTTLLVWLQVEQRFSRHGGPVNREQAGLPTREGDLTEPISHQAGWVKSRPVPVLGWRSTAPRLQHF